MKLKTFPKVENRSVILSASSRNCRAPHRYEPQAIVAWQGAEDRSCRKRVDSELSPPASSSAQPSVVTCGSENLETDLQRRQPLVDNRRRYVAGITPQWSIEILK